MPTLRNYIARKTAPETAVTTIDSDPSEDTSAEESEEELPEENGKCGGHPTESGMLNRWWKGEINGNEDAPSRQLRREARMSTGAETMADAARLHPLSSPSKNVHFSNIVEDDQEVIDHRARESAYLLRTSKSRQQTEDQSTEMRHSTGKLKRPTMQNSSPYNGKIDDPTRPSLGHQARNAPRPDIYEMEQTPERKRRQSKGPGDGAQRSFRLGSSPARPSNSRSSGIPWSNEEANTLKVLTDADLPFDVLTGAFPDRTEKSIRGRVYSKVQKKLEVSQATRQYVLQKFANLLRQRSRVTQPAQTQPDTPGRSGKRLCEQEEVAGSSGGPPPKRSKTQITAPSHQLQPQRAQRVADIAEGMDNGVFIPDDGGQPARRVRNSVSVVIPRRTSRRSPRDEQTAASTTPNRSTEKLDNRRSRRIAGKKAANEEAQEADAETREEAEAIEEEDQDKNEYEADDAESSLSLIVDRLYGQQAALNGIFTAIRQLKRRKEMKEAYSAEYREQHELSSINKVSKLCEQAASNYAELRGLLEHDQECTSEEQELEQMLLSVYESVARLNPDEMSDDEDGEGAYQIYACIFVGLIQLLNQATKYYSAITGHDDPQATDIDLARLQSIIIIASAIESLDKHSRDWKSKPDTSKNIVKPIRNNAIAPLKKVLKIWRDNARSIEAKLQKEEAKRQRRETLRPQREQEEREVQARVVRQEKIDRLRRLYLARMVVEPDVRLRRHHLRMPKLSTVGPEVDANGDAFERVAVFTTRNPADHIPNASDDGEESWSYEQRRALEKGLERFAGSSYSNIDTKKSRLTLELGRNAWANVFRLYCGPGGPLRSRNVAEILRQARYCRETWIMCDKAVGRETEDWIINIPDLDLLELL